MIRNSVCAALAIAAAAGSASAQNTYYIRSVNGDAWGCGGNQAAMDVAFGPGNWGTLSYETLNVGQTFSDDTSCVYIDGGNGNATSFKNFFATNPTAIENWVAGGGSIFINAAGWYESQINVGFQNTIINGNTYDNVFHVPDAGGPIAAGPFQPAGQNYTGNYASHGFISGGPGLTTLGENGAGQASLVDFFWGGGHVVVGALTDPQCWWQPQPNAINVRANMLNYMCRIPAPGSVALLGVGGLVALRRRR
jgi:hypothetical protein